MRTGGFREVVTQWGEDTPESLSRLGSLPLDAGVVACSATHYLHGVEGDRVVCQQLSDQFGYTITSSALVTLEYLRAHAITAVALIPFEFENLYLTRQPVACSQM